jgi:hypothetical protein
VWRRLALAAAAACLASGLAAAQPARFAQPAAPPEARKQVALEVLVAHISDAPGGIDPRAGELDRQLSAQFRYTSLRVLDQRHLDLPLQTIESLDLPNGRRFQVRPLQLSPRGVLLALTVQGTLRTDMRVPNGHLVVIGAERFEDGKLVISLKPSW